MIFVVKTDEELSILPQTSCLKLYRKSIVSRVGQTKNVQTDDDKLTLYSPRSFFDVFYYIS